MVHLKCNNLNFVDVDIIKNSDQIDFRYKLHQTLASAKPLQ